MQNSKTQSKNRIHNKNNRYRNRKAASVNVIRNAFIRRNKHDFWKHLLTSAVSRCNFPLERTETIIFSVNTLLSLFLSFFLSAKSFADRGTVMAFMKCLPRKGWNMCLPPCCGYKLLIFATFIDSKNTPFAFFFDLKYDFYNSPSLPTFAIQPTQWAKRNKI